jgi:hypothetical protein
MKKKTEEIINTNENLQRLLKYFILHALLLLFFIIIEFLFFFPCTRLFIIFFLNVYKTISQ